MRRGPSRAADDRLTHRFDSREGRRVLASPLAARDALVPPLRRALVRPHLHVALDSESEKLIADGPWSSFSSAPLTSRTPCRFVALTRP
jgi:hypothetical protein